jgi:nitrite reductase/ring-hydroxylating ferredoxin subunit
MVDDVQPHTPIQALTGPALRARRGQQLGGLTRRTLLRRALGVGVGLWVVELVGGTAGFLWSAVTSAAPRIAVGTLADLVAANPGLPILEGFPGYVPAARAFVVVVDPGRGGWQAGTDTTGDGTSLNVRALSQVCPHLGCRPNPCVEDFWFRCPCHQSRYDRLGTKPAGAAFGPAPRGMDRYEISVDAAGVLTIDTARITLGPLPIALGQPGVIPARVENGCT